MNSALRVLRQPVTVISRVEYFLTLLGKKSFLQNARVDVKHETNMQKSRASPVKLVPVSPNAPSGGAVRASQCSSEVGLSWGGGDRGRETAFRLQRNRPTGTQYLIEQVDDDVILEGHALPLLCIRVPLRRPSCSADGTSEDVQIVSDNTLIPVGVVGVP